MLVALLQIPKSDEDWRRFSYDNRDSHNRIRQAIQAKGGPNLTEYLMDPINPQDFGSFLEANAQSHIEMCAATGVQSADLESVDLRDEAQRAAWVYTHQFEHYMAETALGL